MTNTKEPKALHSLCKNLIAVIENPNFMINIGHVIRNVNALGVEKLYVVDGQQRLENDLEEMRKRKSLLKHSVAAIKWTEVKRFDSSAACLEALEAEGYISMATSPHQKGKKNVVLHEGDYSHPKLAVWFGNESKGISDLVVDRSFLCINIAMFGKVESLNLSTSTAIVLYEITKQRRSDQ